MEKKYQLCYISGDDEFEANQFTAWFTPRFEKQWGDDWDDAPYEHNSGDPYQYDYDSEKVKREGKEPWYPKIEIVKILVENANYQNQVVTPRTGRTNSPYSVEDINNGAVPWLLIKRENQKSIAIPAGIELSEFKKILKELEFNLYVKEE